MALLSAIIPAPPASYIRTSFTATASQTTFNVTYTPDFVEVYLNGVLLNTADYTSTNGTSIVLVSGAALNDIVEIFAYNITSITTASTAITATNLAGGAASRIPYQTGAGTTAFIANGNAGEALISVGTSTPVFGVLGVAGGGTGITSFGSNVATFLGTPSSSNFANVITDETGSGNVVFNTSPTLVTPALGTPSQGVLSSCTVDGTDAVGFRNVPVNSQSTAYTLVLADSGKVILHPAGDTTARTFTIPANSSVAYPVGTAITFINMTSQVVTIGITTDTMYLSSAGTTGSRTLAQYGSATAIKMTSTTWLISGSGLT